jgi:dienelactone hydrolase
MDALSKPCVSEGRVTRVPDFFRGSRAIGDSCNSYDATKFHDFDDSEACEMSSYHAVAAVVRGHSLLASLPEVVRVRIGITGICQLRMTAGCA